MPRAGGFARVVGAWDYERKTGGSETPPLRKTEKTVVRAWLLAWVV